MGGGWEEPQGSTAEGSVGGQGASSEGSNSQPISRHSHDLGPTL